MNPASAGARPPPPPERWAKIRLFAMDVDGVLTDGTVQVSSAGHESKGFSVLDGLGLSRVRDAGIELAWISGRHSGATTRRAEELKVPHLIQGRKDKRAALDELLRALAIAPEEAVYMGDDDIDIPAMELAGIGVAVPDAMGPVLAAANWVTRRGGGRGAVREVCDLLLAARRSAGNTRAAEGVSKESS
ncbi:MAG: HAD family hydrolase [Puniceicoccaceae bacterium]|nr:MAG: HAD family hydrolase [Puniceicoccaceae bacterium]